MINFLIDVSMNPRSLVVMLALVGTFAFAEQAERARWTRSEFASGAHPAIVRSAAMTIRDITKEMARLEHGNAAIQNR